MAKAVKAKQLSIMIANRVGLLTEIAGALASAKVNVTSLCAYVLGDQATFLIAVDKHATAKSALGKAGYQVTEESVIRLDLTNKPGELAKAAAKISGAGVDMDYVFGTAAGRTSTVVIKSKDDVGALKALRK